MQPSMSTNMHRRGMDMRRRIAVSSNGKIHEEKQTRRETRSVAWRAFGRSESRPPSCSRAGPGSGAATCWRQRSGTAARAFANQRTRSRTGPEVRNRSENAGGVAGEGPAIADLGGMYRQALSAAPAKRDENKSVSRASAQRNDLDHFLRRRESLGNFHRAGNAQRLHAFLVRELPDLGIVGLRMDQVP